MCFGFRRARWIFSPNFSIPKLHLQRCASLDLATNSYFNEIISQHVFSWDSTSTQTPSPGLGCFFSRKSLQASEDGVAFLKCSFLITWQLGTHLLGSQCWLSVFLQWDIHSFYQLWIHPTVSPINFDGLTLYKVITGRGRTLSLDHIPSLLAQPSALPPPRAFAALR